jgi:hypothetical protein
LAAIQVQAESIVPPPSGAVLWISNQGQAQLAAGSRSLLWTTAPLPSITIDRSQPLRLQLQKSINF